MNEAEIELALVEFQDRGMQQDEIAKWRGFLESDTGNQFIMLNMIDMADNPPPMPNTPANATAADLMDVYMEHMYRELVVRACHPLFGGQAVHAALDLAGIDNAENWDMGALMRYRSRRDLVAIALHPDTGARHDYKIAALDKTIAIPVEPMLYYADPRVLLLVLLVAITSLVGYLRAKP
jgi:hypothetical protein